MDSAQKFPILQQAMARVQVHCLGRRQDPEERASAVVAMFERLLSVLIPILGSVGSLALLRRSLKLTEHAFPCYREVRGAEEDAFLNALGACLRREPEIAEASLALSKTFVELLATFIGEPLTRHLLQVAWADILSFPSKETPQ
jgi:hypothetical protein